jgi:hypothetical protein
VARSVIDEPRPFASSRAIPFSDVPSENDE